MGYGEEIVRVTIGSTTYVVYDDTLSRQEKAYDVHATGDGRSFRFFGTFNDPKYLDKDALGELIRKALRMRTGIPG